MRCEDFAEAVSALADGSLPLAERPRVEAHIEACDECRALLDDLRALRREAAALPAAPVPPAVWPRLAARLREQGVRAHREPGTQTGWWQWAAIAALLVIAVGAGVLVTWPRQEPATVADHADAAAQPAAASGNAPDQASVQSVEAELNLAETHYERAISGLEQVAASGQETLDPEVAETVKRNLEVIDQAIAESRTALKSEPRSQPARESLFEALRRKIGLLQDTIVLMNEMRKGNQAGAAQIVEGNKS